MLRIISSLLLISISISCKRDPVISTPPPQTIDLLTKGSWQSIAHGFDDDNSGTIESYENLLTDCQKDNTTKFNTNGTGTVNENQVVCGTDPVSNFAWKFVNDDKAIEIMDITMNIQKLTETELHLIIEIPYVLTPVHSIYRKLP